MSHAFVTIVAPVRIADIPDVRDAIESLQNPARRDIAEALDKMGRIHFASMNVFTGSAVDRGHLVLEFSGDGSPDDLLAQLANVAGTWLTPVFAKAEDFPKTQDIISYWRSKTVTPGQGYFSTAGLVFTGTPGMSVGRIRSESNLANEISRILPQYLPTDSALKVLTQVRDTLRGEGTYTWAFNAEPTPLPGEEQPFSSAVFKIAVRGVLKYLWPLAIPAFVAAILDDTFRQSWVEAMVVFLLVLLVEFAVIVYAIDKFTQTEDTDVAEDRNPPSAKMADLMQRENHYIQNHLDVHTVMKNEPLRGTAIRLVFFVIGQLCTLQFKPGFLASIGSIHFARWILIPGTRDLLFFSNYDGSWESYLEDFITKAHAGLTGVWSNTEGFPRTKFLFQQGATDGDRFKRWARGKQVPSRFWYSAYPQLTTSNIRTNATIRQGLAAASTEDEARDWLSLFGSAPYPVTLIEADEVQSLLFGSFSPLQESECILFRLNREVGSGAAIAGWISHVLSDISFGERVPPESALILGVTPSLIERCGLPQDALDTFPNAFLQGMSERSRSRILGDVAKNAPEHWEWGGPKKDDYDGIALIYGGDKQKLDAATARFMEGLNTFGHDTVVRIPLKCTPPRGNREEPFGFRDGISQPVLHGTFRTQRPFDPIHLVEPGEFILGYKDNRGHFPPTPTISSVLDPDNLLALVPGAYDAQFGFARPTAQIERDLGRNGSFLVVRQLEQDVAAFNQFVSEAAAANPLGRSSDAISQQTWVAAKLVGRWPDGSSLVRNPSYPASIRPSSGGPHTEPAEPDNAFLFGVEDPQGLRCPFGAHIRRANPRDSFAPGSTDQISITNRHRILRAGRHYEKREAGDALKQGLLFVCLNADFERQFEFIQQTWMLNPSFNGLSGEADPLLGSPHSGHFTIPLPSGPVRIEGLSSFVQVKGGSYFFLPGKRTLAFLAKHTSASGVPGTV